MAQLSITTTAPLPSLPLALYSSECIAYTIVEPFGECDIVVGLDNELITQLITLSQDTSDEALARTSDSVRFKDSSSYESWFHTDRTPFALIHQETSSLMALVWIGPKPLGMMPPKLQNSAMTLEAPKTGSSDLWDTVSFRSYPPYRGKGFMTSFMEYLMQIYCERFPTHHLWAGIDRDNAASRAFATKLGFSAHGEDDGTSERITMIRM